MAGKARVIATTVLLVAVYCTLAVAQATPRSILQIDTENRVQYVEDIFDVSKFATNPNVTPAAAPFEFQSAVTIADIVAVNGQPAKGTFISRTRRINTTPTATAGPGQAVADIARQALIEIIYEIQTADGNPIGTIMTAGFGGPGTPPPGSPLGQVQGNQTIVGGTGAFLGARGQQGGGTGPNDVPQRTASMAEDPANRRKNGGGRNRELLVVIPLSTPEIVVTASGPAVTHSSDFSLVTASKPAAAGEILSLFVTGLGPTKPGVDPGKPFPASPASVVNSPVDVTVNGKSAEVTAAVGFPGTVDGYQVNFRVPSDAAKGTTTIQVSAAWIAGPAVSIVIQ